LAAAQILRTEEARGVLYQLVTDTSIPPRVALEALETLLAESSRADALPMVEAGLRSCHVEVHCRAVRGAGRLGDPGLLPALCRFIEEGGPEEQVAAASALARIPNPRSEAALIALLARPTD
jgi:HEAT repeat protein